MPMIGKAVRAEALRWVLRQGPRSYETQQARNLYNARKRDKVTRSARGRKPLAVVECRYLYEKGEGKAGASRRGKTSSSSGRANYWA